MFDPLEKDPWIQVEFDNPNHTKWIRNQRGVVMILPVTLIEAIKLQTMGM